MNSNPVFLKSASYHDTPFSHSAIRSQTNFLEISYIHKNHYLNPINIDLSNEERIKILNGDDLYGIMQKILPRTDKIDQDREQTYWLSGAEASSSPKTEAEVSTPRRLSGVEVRGSNQCTHQLSF